MLNGLSFSEKKSDSAQMTPNKAQPSHFKRTLNYFKGIHVRDGVLYVRQTGQQIPIDRKLFGSIIAVLRVYLYLFGVKLFRFLTFKRPLGTIAFVPHMPAFWYNIWFANQIAGLRSTADATGADSVFVFEDSTINAFDPDTLPSQMVKINHRISDVTKTRVGVVFEQVFGYAISIDPLTYDGEGIRKSNQNGAHDGVKIRFPLREDQIVSEFVYQRLVDTTNTPGICEDLRIAYVFGEIPVVYHKFKDTAVRFGTEYLRVDLRTPEQVFSATEIEQLVVFCDKMGLDFGAVDVMRDKTNGRIYVVDVNKTCMPVLSLTFREQMNAQRRIATAFLKGLEARLES